MALTLSSIRISLVILFSLIYFSLAEFPETVYPLYAICFGAFYLQGLSYPMQSQAAMVSTQNNPRFRDSAFFFFGLSGVCIHINNVKQGLKYQTARPCQGVCPVILMVCAEYPDGGAAARVRTHPRARSTPAGGGAHAKCPRRGGNRAGRCATDRGGRSGRIQVFVRLKALSSQRLLRMPGVRVLVWIAFLTGSFWLLVLEARHSRHLAAKVCS